MPEWTLNVEQVDARIADLEQALGQEKASHMLALESIADLEAATDSLGWRRIAATGQHEFSEMGLRRIVLVCQLVALKNPLLKRGLALRAAYTWGQGVDITAPDPRVDKVIQDFVADQRNQDALFGPSARVGRDFSSGTDGNLFIACYTRPLTGRVQVRTVPFLEIGRVIHNPDDRLDAWFYRRDFTLDSVDQYGFVTSETRYVWHPAIGQHPGRPKLAWLESPDRRVQWDAPMLHICEERPDGWTYGVPVAYAAVDWAIAYKEFLSDWAIYMKALSQFAWRQTGPGRKQARALAQLASVPSVVDPATGEPMARIGATAQLGLDQTLEAIPKTGATIDANSGAPLANMVAAAIGFPVTMLLGDPSKGDRSAAENLDRPTELLMELHQKWWADAYRQIFEHVIDSSVRAPKGHLRGKVTRDDDGREVITLANGRSRTVQVNFADLDDISPAALVDAIVKANETGVFGPLEILRMLAEALNHPDPDAVVAAMTGEDGNFSPPPGSKVALDMELLRVNIDAAKAAAKAGVTAPALAAPPSTRGTTQKSTDAENPNDPAPEDPDPAESPTKAKNRAQRAPAVKESADDGTQDD